MLLFPDKNERQERVLSALQVSYDDLGKEQKLMIYCLVCYPESCRVKFVDLVEHWLALQKRDAGDGFAVLVSSFSFIALR